jgi:hypothetical protein
MYSERENPMTRTTMSLRQLAEKVDWEGGPLEALEYGITAEDVEDPSVRELWQELQDRYRALTPLVHAIRVKLRSAGYLAGPRVE